MREIQGGGVRGRHLSGFIFETVGPEHTAIVHPPHCLWHAARAIGSSGHCLTHNGYPIPVRAAPAPAAPQVTRSPQPPIEPNKPPPINESTMSTDCRDKIELIAA
ncbi:GM22841 [Drosophila sechellia]|uniref:GM22841 n=1 Tax=Drosophila sechellia TaxID=7238 RepID=B4I6M3_DROSE|nr:GM22841 [Drosophila sechellia]